MNRVRAVPPPERDGADSRNKIHPTSGLWTPSREAVESGGACWFLQGICLVAANLL